MADGHISKIYQTNNLEEVLTDQKMMNVVMEGLNEHGFTLMEAQEHCPHYQTETVMTKNGTAIMCLTCGDTC